jgi:hypothetical protein
MWAITRMQVMLSFICLLVSFCGVVNRCDEIIMCVVYVVSCVGISLLAAIACCGCSCSTVLLVQDAYNKGTRFLLRQIRSASARCV